MIQILIIVIFLASVFLNIAKANSTAISLYALQSFAVSAILFLSYLEHKQGLFLLVILVTVAIKVIAAPSFFSNLIKKHQIKFSANTYLSTPLTLLVVTALTVTAYSSNVFSTITSIMSDNSRLIGLSLAIILISIFLIINRKGVISQMIGVLSLENGIVCFANFSGLEQNPSLQIGIIFDIFIWIAIATVFASMIYNKFGSLDTTDMNILKY